MTQTPSRPERPVILGRRFPVESLSSAHQAKLRADPLVLQIARMIVAEFGEISEAQVDAIAAIIAGGSGTRRRPPRPAPGPTTPPTENPPAQGATGVHGATGAQGATGVQASSGIQGPSGAGPSGGRGRP